MNRSRCEMVRFDLHIPKTAVEAITNEADMIGMPPRTYARVLLLEKIEELATTCLDEERCYICKRTAEEVETHMYSAHLDNHIPPLKNIDSRMGGIVKLCVACEGLIQEVASEDLDWLDEYVKERISEHLIGTRSPNTHTRLSPPSAP